MALNWKSAQKSEKLFWKNIYIKKIFDKAYVAGSNEQYVGFVKEIFKRHKINIKKIKTVAITTLKTYNRIYSKNFGGEVIKGQYSIIIPSHFGNLHV